MLEPSSLGSAYSQEIWLGSNSERNSPILNRVDGTLHFYSTRPARRDYSAQKYYEEMEDDPYALAIISGAFSNLKQDSAGRYYTKGYETVETESYSCKKSTKKGFKKIVRSHNESVSKNASKAPKLKF